MHLMHRIKNVGSGPNLHVVGQYGTPEEMPTMRISITPGTYQYEDLTALITADGAPVAATGAGTWGQLYAAGRM